MVKNATQLWEDQLFSCTLCTLQVPSLMLVLCLHQTASSWCPEVEDQHVADSDPVPLKLLTKGCAVGIAALVVRLLTCCLWVQLKESWELPLVSSILQGIAALLQIFVISQLFS